MSSTYTDLDKERTAVIQAIQRMDHLPAGMELFPAADEDQWELIKQVIDQSDYYVVVVAGRYGSLGADGISYTEKEYDYAVESGIPVLGFVHKDPGSIPGEKLELDAEAQRLLAAFRKKVQSRPVNFFTSAEGLSGLVVTSLIRAIKNHPRVGWVRGDHAATPELRAELETLKRQLAEERLKNAESEAMAVKRGRIDSDADHTIGYTIFYENARKAPGHIEINENIGQLFSEFGEMLLVENSEYRIRETIGTRRMNSTLPDRDNPFRRFEMHEYEFKWLIVYFYGLGLIEPGVKRRAADDDSAYWRLTDWGRSELFRLHSMFKLMNRGNSEEGEASASPTE